MGIREEGARGPAHGARFALLLGLCASGGCGPDLCAKPRASTPCPAGATALSDCFASSGIVDAQDPGKEVTAVSVAAGDLDGDGLPEVFLGSSSGDQGRLYHNLGEFRFVDTSCTSQGVAGMVAGAFGDLDNDGHLDLVTVYGQFGGGDSGVRYLRNDGLGNLVDRTSAVGLSDTEHQVLANVSLFDLNLDGVLDVVALPHQHDTGTLAIWLSTGSGTWSRQPSTLFPRSGWTHAVFPTDFNNDGLPDLMVLTDDGYDKSAPPRLHIRQGAAASAFQDQPVAGIFGDHVMSSPMGVAAFDLDGDGRLEYAVSDDSVVSLIHLIRGGVDHAKDAGAQRSPAVPSGTLQVGWSPSFVDLDADGHPELFLTTHNYDGSPGTFAVVWRWDGQGLVDASSLLPDQLSHSEVGLSVADFDGDGRPDLLTGGFAGPSRLLRNNMPGGNTLTLRLRGNRLRGPSGCNADGYGARVTVEVEGQPAQARELFPGGTTQGWSEARLRFGLGAANSARVTVDWRTCGGTAVQQLGVVPSGTLSVDEPG